MKIIIKFFSLCCALLILISNNSEFAYGIGNVDWVLLKENKDGKEWIDMGSIKYINHKEIRRRIPIKSKRMKLIKAFKSQFYSMTVAFGYTPNATNKGHRFSITVDGGINNHSGNNSNLTDRREKKDERREKREKKKKKK